MDLKKSLCPGKRPPGHDMGPLSSPKNMFSNPLSLVPMTNSSKTVFYYCPVIKKKTLFAKETQSQIAKKMLFFT